MPQTYMISVDSCLLQCHHVVFGGCQCLIPLKHWQPHARILASIFRVEDGGNMFLQNVGNHPQYYTSDNPEDKSPHLHFHETLNLIYIMQLYITVKPH
jgi:hypothetical protein